MKKIFLACLSLVLSCIMISAPAYAYAENSTSKLYSKNEIAEDVKVLVDKLERIHPNLYFSIDKEAFNKQIHETLNEIQEPITETEFFKRFAPIISKIEDGHTFLKLPNSFIKKVTSTKNLIPITVVVKNKKLYLNEILIKALKNQYQGYEITAINNKNSSKLYSEMIKYTFGKQSSFKETSVQRNFGILYHLDNDFKAFYEINLKDSTGNEFKITLQGKSFNYIKNLMTNTSNKKEYKLYEYKVLDNNIALINFNSCSDFEGFKKFLDTSFQDMKEKGINDLIIDLRKNGGGSSKLAQLLVEYIYAGNYKPASKVDIKISKEILDYYNSNQYISKEEMLKFKNRLGQTYTFTSKATRSYTEKPVFHGNTYFLIGKNTFSSAVILSSMVKDYHIGYLIGEETGGLATHYGDIYNFNLPNTNLLVGVSHKHFARPNGLDTHRGVLPDYYEKDLNKDALYIAIDIIMSKRN
ncbi:S41 family peptidase [Clostridium ganghwense]|uniref:S41 family peptidase n=1 Tax=Clostridium ganghwense TaxID=312089 RepID=A0ABT4CKX6_9CLOT|nr:S41 family peptidase [Clostridium ganghwense]MCY6369699.1 S41 family peptidase [Clostridium ganghwense]